MDGPGCIWRIWTARASEGHIKMFLDGQEAPAVDLPFEDFFNGKQEPFTRTSMTYGEGNDYSAKGYNCYIPIPYNKSCKIVAEPGWYQVMLVAGGTRAQGALPTVGIVVNGANYSTTNGRLLSESWQRMAVGVPFKLATGDHIITPYFANDFYVPNVVDRNLYLDRIEIARSADAELDSSSDAGGMMMAGAAREMAMMEAEPEGAGVVTDDPLGISTVPLRVAFIRPLDGATLPGLIELEGRCWWENAKQAPPPIVTLMINGNPAMRQRSGALRFWVDPSNFKSGANTIQFVARLDSGSAADTPVQTMFWPAAAASDRLPARNHVRFSIHDERWEAGIKEMLRSGHNPKERRAAAFASNSEVALNVPDDMIGSFHVFLEVLGEHFDGAPIAAVYLRHGDEKTAVGEVEAPGWWDMTRSVGLVELAAGPKQLIVAFENDKYEEGKGDRNLWLQAVILAQKSESDDRAAPVVDVAYPADNQDMYMADALVGQASDNASLRSVELIIDGVETGQVVTLNTRPGDFVLPLLLRSVEPGPHTVAARVTDLAGNSTLSEPRTINVLPGPPQRMGQYERAIHLLNRFAYGPDQRELAAVLTMGESAWLADRLERSFEDPGDLAALAAGLGYFINRNQYEVPRRVISHLLLTPNPVRARFVLWTENHFSTWIRKINGVRKWDEHIAFSRLGPAPFHALLLTSAESPAMLGYLDQDTSFAGRLNENYAREIMELHTLGVDGGYSQGDVTKLAGLLTGWTAALEGDGRGGGPFAARYTYRFDPKLNDGSATSILGMRFPRAAPQERFDRIHLALELLVAHPSTARFVSRSLAEHYVGVPAPDALVERLAAVFTETAGDMQALLIAISEHPAFWDAAASQRVAAPLDYGIRLSRTTGHYQPWQLGDFLQRSGQGLFDRPTPDGYPEDDAGQTDSNALLQRWRLAREWMWPLTRLVPGAWRSTNALAQREWTQRVVDVIAVRLTGRVLSENSNQAALDLLSSSTGNRDQRVRTLAPFIAQLPEANLR